MKIPRFITSLPLARRYILGWKVIGIFFAIHLILTTVEKTANWLKQLISKGGVLPFQINEAVAVWILMISFIVVLPPLASFLLQLFFSTEQLSDPKES